ncbi:MAG: exosortase H-associated membrane protein [Comamonas sp.]|nr:hypothetical protein [Comamonas sp.]
MSPVAPARQRSVLLRFGLVAAVGIIVLTFAWAKASPWLSYPVAALSHIVLEQATPLWTRGVHKAPGRIEVDTAVTVMDPQSGRRGEVTLDADPGRYAYGLPIFWALLLAAWITHRTPGRPSRALLGYVCLLPVQTFSLVMSLWMQLAGAARYDARVLFIDPWQLEFLIYGYQLGALVLPTLAPVLIWLLLDRRFFNEVIVSGWNRKP